MSDLNVWEDVMGITVHAPISAASGDTELVAAVTGKSIVLTSLFVTANADSSFRFESGPGGGPLSGIVDLYAVVTTLLSSVSNTGSLVLPFNAAGWVKTNPGESLSLELTGGNLNGGLSYILL